MKRKNKVENSFSKRSKYYNITTNERVNRKRSGNSLSQNEGNKRLRVYSPETVYKCDIHDNNPGICDIYECSGIKFDINFNPWTPEELKKVENKKSYIN